MRKQENKQKLKMSAAPRLGLIFEIYMYASIDFTL